ncbi:MAG: hypothetical protein JW909_10125 [Planctomycetes bacterium]|nr:hypothetical protein [Planctomycetota bacterium]
MAGCRWICVAVAAVTLSAGAVRAQEPSGEAGESRFEVGGEMELIARFFRQQDQGGAIDEPVEWYPEVCLKLDFHAASDSLGHVKLDLEDTTPSGDLIEEAYWKFSDIGGGPLSLLFGKHEVKYGQDMKIKGTDGLVHGGPTGLDTTNMIGEFPGEKDNIMGIQAGIQCGETTTIYATTFQNVLGTTGGEPDDTGFFQSYAVKAEMKLGGADVEISYINCHDGSETLTENESAVSVGACYETAGGIKLFGEFVLGMDRDYNPDVSSRLFQVGAMCPIPGGPFSVGLMFESGVIDNDTAGADFAEEKYTEMAVSFMADVNDKCCIVLEYMSQKVEGSGGVAGDADSTAGIVRLGSIWKF